MALWEQCIAQLQEEFSVEQFNTWLSPLQVEQTTDALIIYAPNRFVLDWIRQKFFERIKQLVNSLWQEAPLKVVLTIGSRDSGSNEPFGLSSPARGALSEGESSRPQSGSSIPRAVPSKSLASPKGATPKACAYEQHLRNINPQFTFDNFVEGKSNQLPRAACMQVGENPGVAYNPVFIYGAVGLGKTHLMHAVGNSIIHNNPQARVVYLHSERFVADMVRALQTNAMNEFKRFYRNVDALLIDDIQFFANKDRTQEEFFHTFNALLESQQQMILTCDRYPKEVQGLEERLKSRFGWGLTVAVEPPELETRVAILMSKAEQSKIELPYETAFYIAKRIRSNVRELEGALKRVIANAQFTGRPITLDFVKDSLRDLLTLQDKLVSIENIQKTVAEYYKIKLADLLSKRRTRSVARPRQMAMALCKELTNHSLPEIGEAFGGRDHTTVLHAWRKIQELIGSAPEMKDDHTNLLRVLTT